MSNTILDLYNKIYLEEQFPETWRTAIVVPIPKPGKDHNNPFNYRPIALTCCMCKLLEKIVNIRIMWYLESNDCIKSIQSGFRDNRSTTDQLVKLEQDLHTAITHRQHTIAVFFDLNKDYDTAWRYGVMKNLYNYGLRGHLPVFIQNFMSDRKIKVRIGNTLSDAVVVPQGIPQGSVLSCTCFIVAINTIIDYLPNNVKATLYVDDYTIYSSGNVPQLIERRIQTAINRLTDWSHVTGFTFSISKSVSMHICRKRNCTKLAPNLNIENRDIICVDSHKFLGLTFDNSLTWKKHIQSLKHHVTKPLTY